MTTIHQLKKAVYFLLLSALLITGALLTKTLVKEVKQLHQAEKTKHTITSTIWQIIY